MKAKKQAIYERNGDTEALTRMLIAKSQRELATHIAKAIVFRLGGTTDKTNLEKKRCEER